MYLLTYRPGGARITPSDPLVKGDTQLTTAPMTHSIEPIRRFRAKSFDFGYDYEVQIALPIGYDESDTDYPVLWVMDGGLYFHLAASVAQLLAQGGRSPHFIVVGVGHDRRGPAQPWIERRMVDFFPMEDVAIDSIGNVEYWTALQGGRAKEFLSFLVDELRPALAAEFRMRPDRHTLSGTSGGGYFATYAMLTRPDTFAGYLAASCPFNLGHGGIFEIESDYAATHADLEAKVYFTAGTSEVLDPGAADLDLVASTLHMATTLQLRRYPSLEIQCQLSKELDHWGIPIDLYKEGLPKVWGSEAGRAFIPSVADES